MAATRKSTSTESAAFNPAASRTVSTGGIPARVGRPRNNYAAWEPEVSALYDQDDLSDAFTYHDVPKCQSVANGLRREFGVRAVTSEINKETGVGILHIALPLTEDGKVDDTEMAAIREKYAKK